MPRLLPRLLERLQKAKAEPLSKPPLLLPRRRRKTSLLQPIPSLRAESNDHSQSILVDTVNPVVDAKGYIRHKSLPPRPPAASGRVRNYPASTRGSEHDVPRDMTAQEKAWWSSPYLRMLLSPLRVCMLTGRCLPSDFMLRMAVMQQPATVSLRPKQFLLPDGIEHPRFKARKSTTGGYVVCWKTAVQQLMERGSYRRLSPQANAHAHLTEQIGHLLRLRVLQELEILGDRLQCIPRGSLSSPLIRKLTRAEWKELKETGILSQRAAIAVVVCPPVNRDPQIKARPQPTMISSPHTDFADDLPTRTRRELPPLSVLHSTSTALHVGDDIGDILPAANIPLYNGVALFPKRSHRTAFHALLTRLLKMERRARYQERKQSGSNLKHFDSGRRKQEETASHAFVVYSSSATLDRADVVPFATALWRVRIWEGAGWDDPQVPTAGGWEDPGL